MRMGSRHFLSVLCTFGISAMVEASEYELTSLPSDIAPPDYYSVVQTWPAGQSHPHGPAATAPEATVNPHHPASLGPYSGMGLSAAGGYIATAVQTQESQGIGQPVQWVQTQAGAPVYTVNPGQEAMTWMQVPMENGGFQYVPVVPFSQNYPGLVFQQGAAQNEAKEGECCNVQ